ncbi:MAG TPA: D-alanyl-D-alanine endopeptidase [Burkholderiaceae bacterium]|jgi:D-alanyl-D-alanine endopeptidase (penicillin-binding protein 7)
MLKFALHAAYSILLVLCVSPMVQAEESTISEVLVAPKIDIPKQEPVSKQEAVAPASSTQTTAAPKRHTSTKSAGKTHKSQASLRKRSRVVKKIVMVHGRRKVVFQRVTYTPAPAIPSAGDLVGLSKTHDPLDLKSNVALVLDQSNAQVLFEKNSDVALPIASITKLMTGLIVVEAHQNMDEVLEITNDDIDREKGSTSRLRIGAHLTRANMLHIALMSSENRAASALGRNYPGGLPSFVAAMNAKAKALGMNDTHYVDSNGLSSHNVSTARDLAKLVIAAHQEPILCQYSTDTQYDVNTGRRSLHYANTNHLVKNPEWDIDLQKTGYINEAGRCLVMLTKIEGRSVIMVLLDSKGKLSRIGDASRIRKWLESAKPQPQAVSALKHGTA